MGEDGRGNQTERDTRTQADKRKLTDVRKRLGHLSAGLAQNVLSPTARTELNGLCQVDIPTTTPSTTSTTTTTTTFISPVFFI